MGMDEGMGGTGPGRYARTDWGWLLQAATGLGLVVLGTVHLITQHFTARKLLDYAEVTAWLRQPWVLVVEILFLGTVVAHAVLGVRSILLDLGPSPAAEQRVTRLTLIAGVALVVYGVGLTALVVMR